MRGDETKTAIQILTVAVEDLVPLETKLSTAKSDPLRLGYEPHTPRVPPFDYGEHTKALMTAARQATTTSLYCATAPMVDEQVEIPKHGLDKGNGVIQCWANDQIATGTLRLYPDGGTLLHLWDGTGRSQFERRFNVKSCYMRGEQVSGKVRKGGRKQIEEFLMYVFGYEATYRLHRCVISPFWGVMLAKSQYFLR